MAVLTLNRSSTFVMVAAFATSEPTGRSISASNKEKEHPKHSRENKKKLSEIVSEPVPPTK